MTTENNIFHERKIVDSVNESEQARYAVALRNADNEICPLFAVYSEDLAKEYAKELGKGCEDGLIREFGVENRAFVSALVTDTRTNEIVLEIPFEYINERDEVTH